MVIGEMSFHHRDFLYGCERRDVRAPSNGRSATVRGSRPLSGDGRSLPRRAGSSELRDTEESCHRLSIRWLK